MVLSALLSTHAQKKLPPPRTHAATLDTMLRSLIIGQCVSTATLTALQRPSGGLTPMWLGPHPIPADLQAVVFSACLANGDEDTFDQLTKVWGGEGGGEWGEGRVEERES